jgi:hypothetical protein
MTRFKVARVTGWTITQRAHGASGGKQTAAAWYVLDTANCFHIVREFRARWVNQYSSGAAEAEARLFAAELESDYP